MTLNVEASSVSLSCEDIDVQYSIDQGPLEMGTAATMNEGGDITISVSPSSVGYVVVSPDGTTLPGSPSQGFTITDITKLQEGDYTIRTELVGGSVGGIQDATLAYVDSEEVTGENGRAVNALDGNPGTIWHTGWSGGNDPQPHEIQLDLGVISNVSGLTYLPRQDGGINGTIGRYEIYVSLTTSDWGSAVGIGTWANNINLKTVDFTAKQGRYVRLVSLAEVNGGPWASAAEIGVVSDGAATCSKTLTLNVNEVNNTFSNKNGAAQNMTLIDMNNIIASNNNVDSIVLNDFQIFPNPTDGDLTMNLSSYMGRKVFVTIIKSNGQEILSKFYAKNHRLEESIDISVFAEGVYILRINCETERISKKLILRKK